LDTRSKIIPRQEARERIRNRPARWVSGLFDPLLAAHVQLLGEHALPGRLLVVEVTNSAHPLLPQPARAELVAALSLVDYVVLGNGGPPGNAADDADITERFVEHVLRRHQEEAGR
jgi:bifunctional ADP-heptose synthase (sugar kinase/adenylyltransferase)